MLFKNSSLNKIFSISIILGIFSIVLFNFIPLFMEKEQREKEVSKNLKNALDLQSLYIESWLDERQLDIQVLSNIKEVKSLDKEQMLNTFTSFVNKSNDFAAIVYVNEDGFAELDTAGNIKSSVDLSDRQYFIEAKKDNANITEVIKGRNNGQPLVIFSVPVYGENGDFRGLIFGPVMLTEIDKVLNQFQMGETGRTFLVDKNGQMISGLHTENEQNESVESILLKQLELAKENEPFDTFYENYQDVEVMGEYRWVNDRNWLIVGEIERKEVLDPFHRTTFIMVGISLVVLFIAIMFMSRVHKRIHIPIQYVLDGARLLIKGEYTPQPVNKNIINQSPTELKELCDIYNEMSDTISKKVNELEESEEKLRTIFSTANDAIIISDRDLRIISWNKAAEGIFGYKDNEILGQDLSKITPKKYLEELSNYFHDDQAKIIGRTVELEGVTKDHLVFPVELSFNSWKVKGDTYYCGIIRDITYRKEREKALQDATRRFKSIYNNAGVGIVLVSGKGEIIQCNPAFEKMLLYQNGELDGTNISKVTHVDDITKDLEELEKLISGELATLQVEKRHIRKDGSIMWGRITISLELDQLNEIEYVIGMIEDITDKKKIDQALRKSEERLKRIVETTPSGVMILDNKGQFTFANTMALEILGVSYDEMTSRHFNDEKWDVRTFEGEKFPKNRSPFLQVFETKKSVYNVEHLVTTGDGEKVMLSINATPLFNCSNEITEVVETIIDVTERISAEEAINDANKALHELSIRDGLTGIYNRRHFDEVLEQQWDDHLKNEQPLSIILFDLDYFKHFNDRYGHQVGDDCLIKVTSEIEHLLKEREFFLARYGGEEFIVILPNTSREKAYQVAEEIRRKIADLNIPHESSLTNTVVTTSVGVATLVPTESTSPEIVIKFADDALYRGKAEGRNRVNVYKA